MNGLAGGLQRVSLQKITLRLNKTDGSDKRKKIAPGHFKFDNEVERTSFSEKVAAV